MRDRDARCSHARLLFDAHLFLGKNKPFLNVGVARRQARCVLRSEEHTSELQSQSNLVCRLLLEKKKQLMDLLVRPLKRRFDKAMPQLFVRPLRHPIVQPVLIPFTLPISSLAPALAAEVSAREPQ